MRILWLGLMAMMWPQATDRIAVTSQDLALFQAVIQQHVQVHVQPKVEAMSLDSWLVIFDRTYRLCGLDVHLWCMPGETIDRLADWVGHGNDDMLFREFLSRNREALIVSNPDPGAVVVEASEWLEALGQTDDFWPAFRSRYPAARGWVRFSAPAYRGSDSAVLYVTYSCGGLCGEGWLIRLSRVDDAWRVVSSQSVWAS